MIDKRFQASIMLVHRHVVTLELTYEFLHLKFSLACISFCRRTYPTFWCLGLQLNYIYTLVLKLSGECFPASPNSWVPSLVLYQFLLYPSLYRFQSPKERPPFYSKWSDYARTLDVQLLFEMRELFNDFLGQYRPTFKEVLSVSWLD